MKVVVTGGAGFIGSHVAEAYLALGHEVVIVDDLSSGHRENLPAAARLEKIDIRSPEAARLIADERPDVINHHAAQMSVSRSVEEPVFDADVNVLGLVNLLEAGRHAGVGKIVFAASGGTVYGDPAVLPPNEGTPTVPLCPYGVSKRAGEHYLEYYSRVYGIPYVALRYGNVFG